MSNICHGALECYHFGLKLNETTKARRRLARIGAGVSGDCWGLAVARGPLFRSLVLWWPLLLGSLGRPKKFQVLFFFDPKRASESN